MMRPACIRIRAWFRKRPRRRLPGAPPLARECRPPGAGELATRALGGPSLAAALALLTIHAGTAAALRLDGTTMGTTYSVEIAVLPEAVSTESLRTGIDGVLTIIEQQMSTYRPDSELSRFNASRSVSWFPVSSATQSVVADAIRVARISAGAFDVTVGPLIDLWGFGARRNGRHRPSPEAIAATRARVGVEFLHTRETPPALRKDIPELAVDLSAIAKGFGVDLVAAYLGAAGIEDYLVEIGGELRGHGRNTRGSDWTVAIERPDLVGSMASTVVRLGAAGIATSGIYRSYFDEDGKRYTHLIDPRSGVPIVHDLVSVSVIADTTMRADALATALLVLGPDDGRRLADQEGIAALFVVRDGSAFRTIRTSSFEEREIR